MDLLNKKKNLIDLLTKEGYLKTKSIINAFWKVPREWFVPEEYREYAYVDEPLPIRRGQTISAPHMVALMTELIEPRKTDVVLEIGAGSGYQAAVLSLLVKKVYTIEVEEELVKFAKENLKRFGCKNVEVIRGDGSRGLPEKAPFDKILVTCAADKIYPAWKEQLKNYGIIVLPLGQGFFQKLVIGRKRKGKLEVRELMDVAFVPLRHDSD
ncbi:MAG: protein-L-isoaspartate O-methyltransferase [Spirochaetes bacterium]|nr:MAG: protein-L-isoaspartate O-methyltransferase [Spirochaetota bacterium]